MKTPYEPPLTIKASWSFDVRKHLIERHNPDTGNMNYVRLLPRDAVMATGMPLLPQESANDADVWWRLSEADRRAFRVVYFHIAVIGAADGGDPTRRAVAEWLRWAAVRQAKSEKRRSWRQAYEAASNRLIDTKARGEPNTMKRAYVLVQGILKARLG
jgi:hypothetical protein